MISLEFVLPSQEDFVQWKINQLKELKFYKQWEIRYYCSKNLREVFSCHTRNKHLRKNTNRNKSRDLFLSRCVISDETVMFLFDRATKTKRNKRVELDPLCIISQNNILFHLDTLIYTEPVQAQTMTSMSLKSNWLPFRTENKIASDTLSTQIKHGDGKL